MYLFTLLSGKTIHLTPLGKKLPAADFSKLLDAQSLIQTVKEDAKQYKESVVKECEQLKEQAEAEGFQQGLEKWSAQIALLEREITSVHASLEKVILPVALQAARKIVGKELEIHPEAISNIISNQLKSVVDHKNVVIYVNRKEVEIVERHKEKLWQLFGRLESLTIKEGEDVQPGGCIIETEQGIINAQLENQWKALEAAFEALMKNKQD